MKTLRTALILASLVLPFPVLAEMSDADYCSALAAAYRQDHGAGPATSTDVANALTSCGTNAKGSIPVLEKALTNEKRTLPKRN